MYSNLKAVPFWDATGHISYPLTNDYLFHMVLQNNHYALKGLIGALLHISPDEIKNIRIRNPIITGYLVMDKEYILDILVDFNDNSIINLEMQVKNLNNWVPRSLVYLCREYDDLQHGDDYKSVKTSYLVGFLDYTLFPAHPEFYATYRMRNIKDGYEYCDSFTISVLELNNINLATDEDKSFNIDKWASLFKSTTWEEVKMLAQQDPYIESAAVSMYSGITDPKVLALCRKRQEEIDGERHRAERLAEQDKQIAEQDKQIAEKNQQINELEKENLRLREEISRLSSMS